MVTTLKDPVSQVLDEQEYHEVVKHRIDLADYDSLCEHAPALKALSNNKSFLANIMTRDLVAYMDGAQNRTFNPNSIIVFHARDYTVRANVWMPLHTDANKRSLEKRAFSYHAPHDHNYNFTTVGYYGVGYESALYEHEFPEGQRPEEGDLDLRFIERIQLHEGTTMSYRAFRDVHEQHPPADVSVSLNLLAHPSELSGQKQFFFNVPGKAIASVVGNSFEALAAHIRMSRHIGDDDTIEPLMMLAQTHQAISVRQAALDELMAMKPVDADYFRREAGGLSIRPAKAHPALTEA